MKRSILTFICTAFSLVQHTAGSAQNLTPILSTDTIAVSDVTTTHLLFKEGIDYVDVGSPFFVADTLEGMLRLKHLGAELSDAGSQRSNLTVITDDGGFYSLLLHYRDHAEPLNFSVGPSEYIVPRFQRERSEAEQHRERIDAFCGRISEMTSNVHLVNRLKNDLIIKVKGIFYHDDRIGFHIELENPSTVDFDIAQILFRTKLKKRFAKDYLYQERIIEPMAQCSDRNEVLGKNTLSISLVFEKFMPGKKERFFIDIFELNGERTALIEIPRKQLLKPKILKKL